MAKPLIPAYIGTANPTAMACLQSVTARMRWYDEQHKIRWERRYGKKYPECKGEFGSITGIRWING